MIGHTGVGKNTIVNSLLCVELVKKNIGGLICLKAKYDNEITEIGNGYQPKALIPKLCKSQKDNYIFFGHSRIWKWRRIS